MAWKKKKGPTAEYFYHPSGKGYVAVSPFARGKYHVIRDTYGHGKNKDVIVKGKTNAMKKAKSWMK